MSKKEKRECAYCGCKALDCLAKCIGSNRYFCNGKGGGPESHIVHYMRAAYLQEFELPPENAFSTTPLMCFVCGSRNAFRLRFHEYGEKFYLVCRTNECETSSKLPGCVQKNACPLISNCQILPQVVRAPHADEYEKIPESDIWRICDSITGKCDASTYDKAETESELMHAKMRYDSLEEFGAIMCQFIDIEKKAAIREEKSKMEKVNIKWSGRKSCRFRSVGPLGQTARVNSALQFYTNKTKFVLGSVTKIEDNGAIHATLEEPLSTYPSSMSVILRANLRTYKKQLDAVNTFVKSAGVSLMLKDVFMGDIAKTSRFVKENRLRKRAVLQEPPREHFKELNKSQIAAVKYALGHKFAMIQGPPGTGKTTVMAVIALSMVAAGVRPILICTQTNVAADFATCRISQTGVSVTRVISNAREAAGYASRFTTKAMASRKFGEGVMESGESDHAVDMERQIISSVDVVCTTCGSAGHRTLHRFKPAAVIFDEAGQCLDTDLLIPLVKGPQRVVLIGDHRQLGPVVHSSISKTCHYDIPLMVRLEAAEFRTSVLLVQYRMHPALSKFPSSEFYGGMLVDGITEADRQLPNTFMKWPNPDVPMFFWNVRGQEEYYDSGLTYLNVSEAESIASLLCAMWQSGVRGEDIGIITPYTGQHRYLIATLPRLCESISDPSFYEELEIASLDAFQGREKTWIIISNVRSNDSCAIGFVRSRRRMNVGITRAKCGLIVIADGNTYAMDPMWVGFMKYCEDIGIFVEGPLDNLVRSTFESKIEETQTPE